MELKQNVFQLNQKVRSIDTASATVSHLLLVFSLQLENSIKKIEHLESCDCKKSCSINGSLSREDGEKWDSGCDQCQCKSGVVTCIRRKCDELKCKNPVMAEGECCPKCLSMFILAPAINKVKLNHFAFLQRPVISTRLIMITAIST